MTMRARPCARMAAVAAPRPDAEPVTIAHKPSPDIALPSCDFGQAVRAGLPYRARKCLQVAKTPLRGILHAALAGRPGGHQRLSWLWLFLIIQLQAKPHPKRTGRRASGGEV